MINIIKWACGLNMINFYVKDIFQRNITGSGRYGLI